MENIDSFSKMAVLLLYDDYVMFWSRLVFKLKQLGHVLGTILSP
jgi:hypothetical protein